MRSGERERVLSCYITGALSGCGSDCWRPLSETPLDTSTNPHIPQGDQSQSPPDQTFQFVVTVNPLTEGLVGSVSCYLNDVELEEGREEYLVRCYLYRSKSEMSLAEVSIQRRAEAGDIWPEPAGL